MQTGWGRTGEHFWGFEAHGVEPDMMTFAKGIGNGLSIGGVVARAELMDSCRRQLDLHLRRQPAGHRGRPGQPEYLLDHDLQANAQAVASSCWPACATLGRRLDRWSATSGARA